MRLLLKETKLFIILKYWIKKLSTDTIADLVKLGGASSLACMVNMNSDVTSQSRKLESLTLTIPVS